MKINLVENFRTKLTCNSGVKIVCYGDSITWGYNSLLLQSKNNYPDKLSEMLNGYFSTDKISVINKGKNSKTSNWGLEYIYENVLDIRPDLAVVMFGINDVVHGTKPSRYKQNLAEMINLMQKKDIVPIMLSPTPVLGLFREKVEKYAGMAVHLFKSENILVIDMHSEIKRKLEMFADPYIYLPDQLHFKNNYDDISKIVFDKIISGA